MKKYRLIKEYPGSPKLNTVFDYWTDGISEQIYNKSNNPSFIPLKTAHQYPEFWEEIVEKDYKVLSFKQDSLCEDLWTEFSHGWCRNSNGNPVTDPYSYDEILNNHLNGGIKYCINSVKRLSDGEVFTVGDLCNPIGECSYNKCKITTIEFCKAGYLRIGSSNYYIGINNIEHSKQPLFTTEDGVGIYEGDKYFQLVISFSPNFREAIYEEIARSNIMYSYSLKEGKEQLNKNGRYYFSTKEAAEEYVLMNKPCLSINDFIKANYGIDESELLGVLKELVKEKLIGLC